MCQWVWLHECVLLGVATWAHVCGCGYMGALCDCGYARQPVAV